MVKCPIKRHKVAKWIRNHDPHICCLQDTHLRTKAIYRLKEKGWKKIFQAKGREIKAGVPILVSDKTDFKTKAIKRHRRIVHNTQGNNPSRGHKYCKHMCTKHRSTKTYKKNLGGFQERY